MVGAAKRVRDADDTWPPYLPGPRDQILALGVIALNYGQLENIFRALFALVTQMNEFQVAALFQRIPNNTRKDILFELMAQTVLPTKLRELVRHFCLGFNRCAENRHDIMHSHSGGTYTDWTRMDRGILLSKYSKAGRKLVCPASLAELRAVADDTHTFALFGSRVATDVRVFITLLANGEEATFSQLPLPDRPPLPTLLSWRPEKDAIKSPHPPRSSRE